MSEREPEQPDRLTDEQLRERDLDITMPDLEDVEDETIEADDVRVRGPMIVAAEMRDGASARKLEQLRAQAERLTRDRDEARREGEPLKADAASILADQLTGTPEDWPPSVSNATRRAATGSLRREREQRQREARLVVDVETWLRTRS